MKKIITQLLHQLWGFTAPVGCNLLILPADGTSGILIAQLSNESLIIDSKYPNKFCSVSDSKQAQFTDLLTTLYQMHKLPYIVSNGKITVNDDLGRCEVRRSRPI
jgi:hypothetical protein